NLEEGGRSMRCRSALSLILAVITISSLNFLSGCGGCNSPLTATTNRSVVGTWTGSITRAADSLSLTITFTSDGSNTTGVGELALINEPTFSDGGPGNAFLLGSATFPVTIVGDQATFTASFHDTSSTNVSSLPVTTRAGRVLI